MAINTGSSWPRNGFTLVNRAAVEDHIRRFPASAGGNHVIAVGQAVTIVNGVVVVATAGQDPAQAGFGIVMGVFNSSGRPFTQQATKFIASGANGLVDVCYDPFVAEYIVRCETSVGPSNINKNVTLTGFSARATLPQIIQSVDIPASASVGDLFRVIRLAEVNDLTSSGSNPLGGSGNAVIVRWNNHVYKAGTAGQ